MKFGLVLFISLGFFGASGAIAKTPRSQAARLAFVRANACPATGLHKLPCKGFIIDHRIALCKGGLDAASNMQWQTIAAAKAKDRWECKP
jgi:hypothetical protein